MRNICFNKDTEQAVAARKRWLAEARRDEILGLKAVEPGLTEAVDK